MYLSEFCWRHKRTQRIHMYVCMCVGNTFNLETHSFCLVSSNFCSPHHHHPQFHRLRHQLSGNFSDITALHVLLHVEQYVLLLFICLFVCSSALGAYTIHRICYKIFITSSFGIQNVERLGFYSQWWCVLLCFISFFFCCCCSSILLCAKTTQITAKASICRKLSVVLMFI